jgi:hypothetical protein
VVRGYIRPTNYELIKTAEAVVLAEAVKFTKTGEGRGAWEDVQLGTFTFRVLERFKGKFTNDTVTVEGDTNWSPWGDPNDFSYSKPDHGPCNPTDYKVGSTYVLLLGSFRGEWHVSGPPFTRVNVEVEGTNAPWVQAVRHYSRIAAMKDYEKEKEALSELSKKASRKEPACPLALVSDIDTHFNKATEHESGDDLLRLYEKDKSWDARERVLWACARGKKPEAKQFVLELVRSRDWRNIVWPVCSYIAELKLRECLEPLAGYYIEFADDREQPIIAHALACIAGSQDQALMQKVLIAWDGAEAMQLGRWFTEYPSPEALKWYRGRVNNKYDKEWELTFVLAGLGDPDVVEWAKEFQKKSGENRWMAFYVLALSPLPAADALVQEIVHGKDVDGIIFLVQGYQDSKNPRRLQRIESVAARDGKTKKLIFWLRRTLGSMVSQGDEHARTLLNKLPVVESEN